MHLGWSLCPLINHRTLRPVIGPIEKSQNPWTNHRTLGSITERFDQSQNPSTKRRTLRPITEPFDQARPTQEQCKTKVLRTYPTKAIEGGEKRKREKSSLSRSQEIVARAVAVDPLWALLTLLEVRSLQIWRRTGVLVRNLPSYTHQMAIYIYIYFQLYSCSCRNTRWGPVKQSQSLVCAAEQELSSRL